MLTGETLHSQPTISRYDAHELGIHAYQLKEPELQA